MLRVRLPPEPSITPCGAVRSPRDPVKVEIVGSNPIEGAIDRWSSGTVRKPAKRPSSNLGDLWVRLPLVPLVRVVFLTAVCKAVAFNCEAVGERFNSFTTQCFRVAPSSTGQDTALSRRKSGFDSRRGCCEWRVEIPGASRWSTRDFKPPGAAGAQPALIRPACPDRHRGLGLRVGRCSTQFHKLGGCGSTPIPAMAAASIDGTVRKLAERPRPPFGRCPEPRDLWVRLPPVLLQVVPRPVVQRQRLLSYKEETGVRFPPGRLGRLSCESGTLRDGPQVLRQHAFVVRRWFGFDSRADL